MIEQIRNLLLPIEPEFDKIAELGSAAVEPLKKLVRQEEPSLSSRATYALGRVAARMHEREPHSSQTIQEIVEGLTLASQSKFDVIRVAAAAATHGLPSKSVSALQLALLADSDIGVRKTVLEAMRIDAEPVVVKRVENLANDETIDSMREIALIAAQRMKANQ